MATFAIAAAIGIVVGVVSGMLGIGGGSVMVPVFRLGFGFSALQATATSLFAIIPTSLAGVIEHVRQGTCLVPLGLACGAAGALLSPVGVKIASVSPGWAIMLGTGAAIIYSSATMLYRGLKASDSAKGAGEMESPGAGAGAGEPSKAAAAPAGLLRSQVLPGIAIGLVSGLLAGFIGLGGGFLMVPLFVSLLGLNMRQASGTSLLAISLLASTGVASHLLMGNVDVVAGVAMAAGTVPGAIIGARFAAHVPERSLRLAFAAFLIAVALFLIINEFVFAT